jgi:hypothetical protein
MKDWLHDNPNGLKNAFEKYSKRSLQLPKKYMINFPSLLSLPVILLHAQIYKDQANAAVRIPIFCAKCI